MANFSSLEEYHLHLDKTGTMPDGFRIGTAALSFLPAERPVGSPLPMKLTLILLDEPTESFGAMFTRNRFPGAPVIIGRQRMLGKRLKGVLVNNKISNVSAPHGVEDAEDVLSALGKTLDVPAEELLPSSTGIIGWSLPKEDMKAALPSLAAALCRGSCLDAARSIMTTDAFPKLCSRRVGKGSIVGFAKGAGMIEPNLATMLVYLMTDLKISRDDLRSVLKEVVEETFNCISVDGDQSTSDTVLLMSSNSRETVPRDVFAAALREVCSELAESIVRNGEGTSHVIRVLVEGARTFAEARDFGKAIANSPLVKTAIYGNDPNVGRILSSLGDFAGNNDLPMDSETLVVRLGEEIIYQQGAFRLDKEKEIRLSAYLKAAAMDPENKKFPPHGKTVDIHVRLSDNGAGAIVQGSDLSYEYVRENADYRS